MISLLTLATIAALPNFNAADKAKLEQGEVLIKSLEPTGGDGMAVKAAAVIPYPPDKVFPTIDKCAEFHEFMPRTEKSEERARIDNYSICFVEIDMPFPLSNLWAETDVRRKKNDDGSYRRWWSLRKGTYNRNDGSWTLYPWPGNKTLAVYQIDVDPQVPIPDAISRSAQSGSLPDLFVAIAERVAKK